MHGWLLILMLGAAGFVSGFIDTLAGGGGLISLPALLASGLPPLTALGTNKLQSVIGEITATMRFVRQGNLQFKKLLRGIIFVAIGSSLGAICVQKIHPTFLEKGLPFLLLAVFIYMLCAPYWLKEKHKPRLSEKTFYTFIAFIIGFYNGFFGPATGSFWVFSFVFFLNYSMVNATINTKPLNTAGNLASLFWFMLGGYIHYQFVVIMAIGQVIGAYIAAHLVMYKGSWLIRPLFIIVVLTLTLLTFKRYY